MKKLIFLLSITALSLNAIAQSVVIEIPDLEVNGTILKRKAELDDQRYSPTRKIVSIVWRVDFYADSNGHYGTKINRPGISSYFKETIANNTVMVNGSTGAFVYKDEEGNYPSGSIGQFDYFFYIAQNVPVKVNDLCRAYGKAVTDW